MLSCISKSALIFLAPPPLTIIIKSSLGKLLIEIVSDTLFWTELAGISNLRASPLKLDIFKPSLSTVKLVLWVLNPYWISAFGLLSSWNVEPPTAWLIDKLPARCVPIITEEAEALVGVNDDIFEKTLFPVTIAPAAPAVSTSVWDFPNWSKPIIVYFSPTSEPEGVIVITEGSNTVAWACVPTFIVLAVLLTTLTDNISLNVLVPEAVAPFTPLIVSVIYSPESSYPLTVNVLDVSLPAQYIFTILLSAFDDFNAPSRIKFPAVDDLLVKRLSSSVVDKTPLGTIATPALKDPE